MCDYAGVKNFRIIIIIYINHNKQYAAKWQHRQQIGSLGLRVGSLLVLWCIVK